MHEELLGSTRQNHGIFPAWHLSIHRPSQRLRIDASAYLGQRGSPALRPASPRKLNVAIRTLITGELVPGCLLSS